MKILLYVTWLFFLAAGVSLAQINTFDGNIIADPGSGCPLGNEITAPLNQAFEDAMIPMINNLRAQNGLPPLHKTEALTQSARYHAKHMCNYNYFSHASQDGNGNTICNPFDRIVAFYTWFTAAENICAGYTSTTPAFEAWVQSQAHLSNMLSTNVYEIGIGYYSLPTAQYGSRWVMNSGKKNGVYPIVINNEALETTTSPITVYAYGSGVFTQMRFKLDNGTWGDWVPFAATNSIDISTASGNSTCTVYAEMRNAAGTVTVSSSDDIGIDFGATPPPPPTPTTLVKVKAMLQGCFNATNSTMTTALQTNNVIPTAQPFNRPPWGYAGNEALTTQPTNMTDWILLELRSSTNSSQIVAQKAAILLNNGNIIDANGDLAGIVFSGIPTNTAYYVSLKTRHHLAVLSSYAEIMPNAIPYDFTNNSMVAGGSTQLYQATPTVCTLLAGDTDGNGAITVGDFNEMQNVMSNIGVYSDSDCNLDRNVTVTDFNLYSLNLSKIGVAQIRY